MELQWPWSGLSNLGWTKFHRRVHDRWRWIGYSSGQIQQVPVNDKSLLNYIHSDYTTRTVAQTADSVATPLYNSVAVSKVYHRD